MKVQDVMTKSVATCVLQDSLHAAAQRLWEHDCGCLPVVDADRRPLAMITDRDVCMAAWTSGKPLHELRVANAMSKQLHSCRAQEEVSAAAARMAKHGVRRLPVLDASGVVVGLLALNDIATAASREPAGRTGGLAAEALRVLTAVCSHREAAPTTAPAASAPSPAAASATAGSAQPPA